MNEASNGDFNVVNYFVKIIIYNLFIKILNFRMI